LRRAPEAAAAAAAAVVASSPADSRAAEVPLLQWLCALLCAPRLHPPQELQAAALTVLTAVNAPLHGPAGRQALTALRRALNDGGLLNARLVERLRQLEGGSSSGAGGGAAGSGGGGGNAGLSLAPGTQVGWLIHVGIIVIVIIINLHTWSTGQTVRHKSTHHSNSI
jgi:hypothetical protein